MMWYTQCHRYMRRLVELTVYFWPPTRTQDDLRVGVLMGSKTDLQKSAPLSKLSVTD